MYNLLGREIEILVEDHMEKGDHRVQWDVSSLPSGIYLYRLKTDGFAESKKLILHK